MSAAKKESKTISVLTIHFRGSKPVIEKDEIKENYEYQTFTDKAYHWYISERVVSVMRNDGKWTGYYPLANVVQIELHEIVGLSGSSGKP